MWYGSVMHAREQTTTPVGRATPHALRIGEQLVLRGRADHARRVREAERVAALAEIERELG